MKTRILSLIFFVSGLYPLFSQQNNPTEKETFEFISYFIENKAIDDIQDDLPIKNFKSDLKNLTLTYEISWTQASGSPNEFRVTTKYVVDLKKIKSVEIKKNNDIDKPDWHWKGSWQIIAQFEKNSVKEYVPKSGVFPPNIIYKDVRWDERGYEIWDRNEASYYFQLKDEKDAQKLYKAFNHLVKLRTGINTNLFDD